MINIPENRTTPNSNDRQIDPLLRVIRDAHGRLHVESSKLIQGFIGELRDRSSRFPDENNEEASKQFLDEISVISDNLAVHGERAIGPLLTEWRGANHAYQILLRGPMTLILRRQPSALGTALADRGLADIATQAAFHALGRSPNDLRILGDMLGSFPREAAAAEIEALRDRIRPQNAAMQKAFQEFLKRVEERW